MNFSKLPGAAGLLFVAIVCASGFCDGLAIGDALLVVFHCNFVDVLKHPLQGAEVELALSVHQNLTKFLTLLNFPSRIFLAHAVESNHHLFGVGLVDGTNGTCKLRIGIFDKIEAIVAVFAVQGVAGADIFELDGATDITC